MRLAASPSADPRLRGEDDEEPFQLSTSYS
ncbi:hypothetical protein KAURM247S_06392 [Kitasatospora aureofaciens]